MVGREKKLLEHERHEQKLAKARKAAKRRRRVVTGKKTLPGVRYA